jgi:hypothetical protein
MIPVRWRPGQQTTRPWQFWWTEVIGVIENVEGRGQSSHANHFFQTMSKTQAAPSSKRKRPRPPTTTNDDQEEGVIANKNNNNNNNNNNNHDHTVDRRAALAAQRRAILTHGTTDKRQELRLRLHLERAKRSLAHVRNRLEKWDAVIEAERLAKEEREKKEPQEQEPPTKKTKKFGGRPSNDPSTWQLKGAARPAAQVYDFDVRYVDRYANDHVHAHESARRQVNRLIAADDGTTTSSLSTCPVGRTFLSLLMQIGHLSAESQLFRQAKEAWHECMQYDDGSITTAQECLLQLYITRRQFQNAYDLGNYRRKSDDDTNNETDNATTTSTSCSAVVCYTTALAAFALHQGVGTAVPDDETTTKGNSKRQKKNKNKIKSPATVTTTRLATGLDEHQVQDYMTQAIRNNVFLAYYIVHYEIFRDVMECQDELEQAADADDDDSSVVPPPQSLLEEAIEYGHSDQVAVWHEVGAHHLLARILLQQTAGGINDWQGPLDRLLVAHEQQQQHQSLSSKSKVDLVMFAGMFRTAMEMVASQQQQRR